MGIQKEWVFSCEVCNRKEKLIVERGGLRKPEFWIEARWKKKIKHFCQDCSKTISEAHKALVEETAGTMHQVSGVDN